MYIRTYAIISSAILFHFYTQMDTLRTVREKLYKDNTALMAQSSLKTAQKNQLMANYFRGQVRGEWGT